MRVAVSTLSAPPARFIGSELMTLRLARALQDAGHEVTVHPRIDCETEYVHDGIRITPEPIGGTDVLICHADYGIRARRARKLAQVPIVAICHNTAAGVKVGLVNTHPDLAVVNSAAMRDSLGLPDALIVNPPAPPVVHMRPGRCITTLSLNELKGGGQFWRLAAALPRTPFLAVQGGYGDQIVQERPNVRVLPHLPPDALTGRVWRHAGIFLQLSESESWGMAAAEAIAHGIPVIAHPTPGVVENLRDAAVYVDRDDIRGLGEAIMTITERPEPFRAAARARAAEHAASSELQVAQWVAAIERLVKR